MSTAADSIQAIIDSRQLTDFITLREDGQFEAKGSRPYDLATAEGRYELAKDASAFANADGGWIVIGLATSRLPTGDTDEVIALDLLPEAAFATSQISGLLRDHVHPQISGLQVGWVGDATTLTTGVGTIRIPGQSPDRKPFLISRVWDGAEIKQIVFGYAQRVGSSAAPHTMSQVHRAMQKGMDSLAERLTRIEDRLSAVLETQGRLQPATSPTPGVDVIQRRLGDRIASLLKEQA